LLETRDGGTWLRVAGDASQAYPGLLQKFVRTVILIPPGTVVVRDVVACEGERHVEWLLHYAGALRTHGHVSIIEHGGIRLTVVPFLPDRQHGWRVNDVTRTSTYECSDTRQMVERSIRYRSFSPFRKAEAFEFLFGLRVDGDETGLDWRFEGAAGNWRIHPAGHECTVQPGGDGIEVVPICG
jgi:hypothetical protein